MLLQKRLRLVTPFRDPRGPGHQVFTLSRRIRRGRGWDRDGAVLHTKGRGRLGLHCAVSRRLSGQLGE